MRRKKISYTAIVLIHVWKCQDTENKPASVAIITTNGLEATS